MARNKLMRLLPGVPVQLTNSDVTHITFQVSVGATVLIVGAEDATEPTDWGAALPYSAGDREISVALAELFPGIAPVRLWAMLSAGEDGRIYVSHAGATSDPVVTMTLTPTPASPVVGDVVTWSAVIANGAAADFASFSASLNGVSTFAIGSGLSRSLTALRHGSLAADAAVVVNGDTVRASSTISVIDVPAQIEEWSAIAGLASGELVISISRLPDTRGGALTALQYTIDSGQTWTALSGVGTGARVIAGLPLGSYGCAVRAVNNAGPGRQSNTRTVVLAASVSDEETGDTGGETETLSYGNDAWTGIPLATNAPSSRQMAGGGDSRFEGNSSGQFFGELVQVNGEWVWVKPNAMNFGDGGSSVYNLRAVQVPQIIASGANVFVILSGTNGAYKDTAEENAAIAADPGANIGSMTEFQKRQYETLKALEGLDQPGSVIFLCNEMPGQSGGVAGSPQDKVDHHHWIDGLTAASAGLTNADLVIVDTWSAVADNTAEDATTSLDPRWANDGLHPANRGQERMARAVWQAMGSYFTQPHLDVTSPDQLLCDGTTTTAVNRGTLPSGWTDASAAGLITYSTTGTGSDTVVTLDNSANPAPTSTAIRITPAATTDAVVLIEYDLDENPDASDANSSTERDFAPRINPRNTQLGASVTYFSKDVSQTGQDQEMGGRRRMAIWIGATATSPRIDLTFYLRAGQVVRLHRVDVYER